MKQLITALLLLISTFSFSQDKGRLNSRAGFGGIYLGDTITNVSKFSTMPVFGYSAPNEKGEVLYSLTSDSTLKVTDRVSFSDFTITYYKGKAVNIQLKFSFADLVSIVDILKTAYGKPDTEETINSLYKCDWKAGNNLLVLTSLTTGNNSEINFISIPYFKMRQEQEKQEVAKAATKF